VGATRKKKNVEGWGGVWGELADLPVYGNLLKKEVAFGRT
jgi:hypothetical protein